MRRIRFAGGTFITGDDEAQVICEYAATLANSGRAATLTLPALDETGRPETVEMVVGPASQMLSEPVAVESAAPDTGRFVADVRAAIERITWRPVAGSLVDDFDI